jgi:hypothetical protein
MTFLSDELLMSALVNTFLLISFPSSAWECLRRKLCFKKGMMLGCRNFHCSNEEAGTCLAIIANSPI